MTIRVRLKAIIDSYTTPDMSLKQLHDLKEQLEIELAQEIGRQKLFIITIDDPRDGMRSQFAILSKALLAEGYVVLEDGNSRKDKETNDVRWDMHRIGDPTDAAVLKLGKDGTWSIVPSQGAKKSDIGLTKLTDVLRRRSPETNITTGWKLAS